MKIKLFSASMILFLLCISIFFLHDYESMFKVFDKIDYSTYTTVRLVTVCVIGVVTIIMAILLLLEQIKLGKKLDKSWDEGVKKFNLGIERWNKIIDGNNEISKDRAQKKGSK